ncbi:galactose-1-phosphate uridylyltransferase [Kineosporia sp. NBRC 101731]|uniref:galactose-1-phosphate uridylyltransferase n=1 Tax=Kineosporia sp. NBRC 101731 TaxID=3032199 RepID=UPI0024A23B33|nr:galactose-1-phosphate uridylyltransferase [Kineosporia sp. NBRC 101731]GLY33187.1 galactose-1-phosphate uridylyltransferase [Kineosporia sp. NBRC 101731]
MSERRFDPTSGEWITFATHRQNRTFLPPANACPLCPDPKNEWDGEIRRPDYEVAVFDNRFPALSPTPPAPDVESTELYRVEPATGRCEVIAYSSDHNATLAKLGAERIRLLIDAWADRYQVLGAEGHAYVLPFENRGEAIGVTLHHPHGQIYAYDDIPARPLRKLKKAAEYRTQTGRCVECDVVAAELEDGRRIIAEGEYFIAHVPFWARYPYEVRISPKQHTSSLVAVADEARTDLSRLMHRVFTGLDDLFGFPLPYVLGIFSSPTNGSPSVAGWDGSWDDISHLHFLISPPNRSESKLKYIAGTEQMGGAYSTDIAPEVAAATLRSKIPS